ncbi:unnamed protein product [Parascedosporium putredinis]|uniref:(4-O-methyl)-D-glucuronate--lignin esterase n=1 Tax=Parascedosporium putredinis TaxID=1442378 RepID=A0A9P1H1D9_9PEZI|nr:unnamed protein product [Parascedosporium putredinis]CAI7995058.1 unnamed protein product [Parascedosporium putredinis]
MKKSAVLLAAASAASAQQTGWGQCGGIGWSGAKTCISGWTCTYQNDWYSQCIPGAPNPVTTTSTTAAPPTTLVTQTSAAPTTTTTPGGGGGDGGSTTCPTTPSGLGTSNANLNDPFTFHSGAKLMQQYELGTLPAKPTVSATYSGSTLTITSTANGKSASFSVTVNKPSGNGPFPAIISYGSYGASIPVPAGVATILFNNDDVAQQQDSSSSRGKGKFYDIYGADHSAGALVAWAWGVGRILDALELTKAQTGIDPARVGVTGCSRNGKGAMVAGALEPRIALTLPQESGSGGAACWRISNWQKSNGQNVQTASQIITENVWFSRNFNSYVNNVNSLPFDHHMLAGLIAPRPMYAMENPDFEWLGTMATYGCMAAAKKQWDALGATEAFGYSQVGGHNHCSFPSAQSSELNSFINKYLLNQSVNTGVLRTDQTYNNFNLNTWASWSVPTLR